MEYDKVVVQRPEQVGTGINSLGTKGPQQGSRSEETELE